MIADNKKIIDEILEIRRRLHEMPELSYKEYSTTELIKQTLSGWQLKFNHFKELETGGFCDIGQGETVLFRADIDGLPVTENKDHEIISKKRGRMHACGHDFHIAIGLGLLRYFQKFPDKLNGKLRVIFQPAEEAAPGGAEYVIKEDIWENVRAIFGIHVNPREPVGKVILPQEIVNASSTSIFITLNGPGGHTSRPDETVDLIHVCCEYVTQMKNFLINSIDPRETLAIAFGKIDGGHSHNAIPQKIILRGTLRSHDNEISEKARELIRNFSTSFGNLNNMKIDVQFPTYTPVTINNKDLVNLLLDFMRKAGRESRVIIPEKPSMGTDDFAFFSNKIPGLYFWIGGAGGGEAHTGDFIIDEKILKPAIEYLSGYIEYYFSRAEIHPRI